MTHKKVICSKLGSVSRSNDPVALEDGELIRSGSVAHTGEYTVTFLTLFILAARVQSGRNTENRTTFPTIAVSYEEAEGSLNWSPENVVILSSSGEGNAGFPRRKSER